VDLLQGRVLFSTTRPAATLGAPLRDPVLYHQVGSPGNFTYMTSTGVPVSTRIGLRPPFGIDDVDGICALDPGGATSPQINRLMGSPSQQIPFPAQGRLGSAVFRRRAQTGSSEEFVSWMTGWPTGQPQPGIAFCCITVASSLNSYTTVASFLRPAGTSYYYSRFLGHPQKFVQRIPTGSVYLGLDVFFTWAAFDNTGLDVSFPVGIKI
jgi:hypothetical protein